MVAASPSPNLPSGASLSDLLTAVQHLVTALNGATQAFNNVNGVSTKEGITAPTVIKTSPGRVASVSIIVAGTGSATGMIYDAASVDVLTAPLWVIPNAAKTDGEPYVVNSPTDTGILIVPATGQKVTVSWS